MSDKAKNDLVRDVMDRMDDASLAAPDVRAARKEAADSAHKASGLSDGGTMTVSIDLDQKEKFRVLAKSNEDYKLDIEEFDETGQSGHSISTQLADPSAGSVHRSTKETPAQSVTVTLTDQSADGSNDATATLMVQGM